MRIFFSLASHFRKDAKYEASIRELARNFDLKPVFAHEAPAGADAAEWINTQIVDCQFAFFDLTGLDGDVLFAYGVVSQSDDVTALTLIDEIEHAKIKVVAGPVSNALIASAKRFNHADDFQRKAHMFINERVGSEQLRDKAFVARIKAQVEAKGPIYMRQLAKDLGKPMPDVQPIVYALVRNGEIKKIGDTSGSRYQKPDA